MRSRYPALVLCVLVGVALGLGAATLRYAQGLSYLSNDPVACVNCHVMREPYDNWQKASHHTHATCNDCHLPHNLIGKYAVKAENGFWHSYKFTLQNYHEPIRIRPHNARVLEQSCVTCHEGLVQEIVARHEWPGEEQDRCVRCHAAVGHGPPR
jgi:cytochrome c nitrite reductase small subunit